MNIGELLGELVNVAGVGGFIVVAVFTTACVVYTLLLRWVLRGGEAGER